MFHVTKNLRDKFKLTDYDLYNPETSYGCIVLFLRSKTRLRPK